MKIESSDVMMSSQHSYSRKEVESTMGFESFIQLDGQNAGTDDSTISNNTNNCTGTTNNTGNIDGLGSMNATNATEQVNGDAKTPEDNTLQGIISKLLKSLSLSKDNASISRDDITKEIDGAIGYLHLNMYSKYEEHESVSMSTSASVLTDQGSLDLNINYSMSRDFVVENQIDVYTPIDPLVINLNGELPSLSTDTFNFDLDNDGETDQVSKLSEGNGFLALDKNNDGTVNQGSELFGTTTGDGFSELGAYDDDNNGWIDENDKIFDKLRVWLKNDSSDSSSQDKDLISLGEAGIGAIYLGSTDTDFTFKTDTNQTLGAMKSSGFYLNEDLTTGVMSDIDLGKQNTKETASPLADLLQA